MDAASMTVQWSRPDLKPRFVHVWQKGKDVLADQNPSYRGRTSVSSDKLKLGDVSLQLSKVKLSDNGTYRCYIPKLNEELLISLSVDVTQPDFTVYKIVLFVIFIIVALVVLWRTKGKVNLFRCLST